MGGSAVQTDGDASVAMVCIYSISLEADHLAGAIPRGDPQAVVPVRLHSRGGKGRFGIAAGEGRGIAFPA